MRKPNIALTWVIKSVFLLAILLLPFISIPSPQVLAEDGVIWVPFVPGAEPETRSQVLAKSADTMGLCVDSSFFGMHSLTSYINETQYNILNVPSAGHTTALGKPAVPMITRYLEVPHNVTVNSQILYKDMQVLEGYNVIPAQEFPADLINATEPPFVIDETTYTTNAFYPSDVASLEGGDGLNPIVIRGHRIVALSLYPVQFNPVTQQVRVYSKIEVRLNYDKPGQVGAIYGRLLSSAFETLLEALVLNYRYPEVLPLKKAGSAEYLIITHDDFFQQVQELAAWKEQKGLLTKVVNTTQINASGPTADDIANYIKNAYDTWNPAPSYVLLVGDSDFIPPHYRNPHPDSFHGGFNIPTDLYYATVDGTDYFPDIYVGRLSVDTTAQATTITDKIIDYERNPPANAAFYNQVAACALFQDTGHWECGVWYNEDGYEDRRYVLTSEEIRDYLLNQGYNVDRIYWADPGNPAAVPPIPPVDPTNYSICRYNNGDPLPPALLRANGFLWDGDDLDVTNAINAGRFLIYHRDHGESRNFWDHRPAAQGGQVFGGIDGWNHPSYTTGDIAGLANAPLLPVVFSVECQSGWFDGEVDQNNDGNLTRTFESFCEEFVRQPNGGAIAAIGSTRNSRSGYNDDMLKGFVDAIWPGFDLNFVSGGLFSLGQILTYGKVYMATQYSYTGDFTRETFELFHLFGDPELTIWTEQPTELDVSHPTHIGSKGLQKFVVNVTAHDTGAPVHHAKVCLKKGTEVYTVAYTDPSGGAYFAVYPSTGGEMKITVTKHNYQHYEGLITVTSDGATLSVDAAIGPSGINVDLQGNNFDSDEKVDIYFGDTLPDKTVNASAGSFTETFTVPTGPVGPMNVRAVGQTSGRTAVTLFRRLPDQPLPDPYIYCQWDSSTWHLNPDGGDPRWNNPDIQLYNAATGAQVASNDLRVGTTYTVEATVHNDATVDATNTVVTFQWTFWGAGQLPMNWILMGSDQVTVPDGGQGTAEVEWTPSITGHTCIIATIHHPWDENLDNNKGQENTHVHPVTSPAEIAFTVGNPTGKDALVYVEARQVGTQDLWRTLIERDYPQVQKPGENRTVTFIVEAPGDADVGEKRIFSVSGYIDGELIGGIEVESVVKTATNISCSISPPYITQGGLITVSGSISPPVSGVTVILTYEKPDGTTFTRIATTDADGSYSDSCPADAVGSWTVTASWEGDSTHAGSLGSTETFAVNTPSPSWCPILLVLIIVFIGIVLFLIRRRGREVKLLGLILIAIIVIVYVWVCIVRPA